jgi:hypothetical protein
LTAFRHRLTRGNDRVRDEQTFRRAHPDGEGAP